VPNRIPFHCPGAESAVDVKVIGCPAVPTADNDPFTTSSRNVEFPCTTTPGSTVSVTPDATVTFPVITYGLFANVHVVLDEIVPDTFVELRLNAAAGINATSTSNTAHGSNRQRTVPPTRRRTSITGERARARASAQQRT
jgi:hypothetical protein